MAYDSSTYVEIKGSAQSQPSADAGPVARARPEASPSAAPEIDPLTLTTPRARLEYLRDFLRGLPARQFNMSIPHAVMGECGTVACIGGWARELFGLRGDLMTGVRPALGLDYTEGRELFYDVTGLRYAEVTPPMAAAVLTHLLNTGEVSWEVARKVEA